MTAHAPLSPLEGEMSPQATEGGNARPTTIDRMVETLRAGAETRRWIDLADLTDAFSDDEIVADRSRRNRISRTSPGRRRMSRESRTDDRAV